MEKNISHSGWLDKDNNHSLLRAFMVAVALSVSGCAGNPPTRPVTEVRVAKSGSTTVDQYCFDLNERACKVITYTDGELKRIRVIACNDRKINGAPCRYEPYPISK